MFKEWTTWMRTKKGNTEHQTSIIIELQELGLGRLKELYLNHREIDVQALKMIIGTVKEAIDKVREEVRNELETLKRENEDWREREALFDEKLTELQKIIKTRDTEVEASRVLLGAIKKGFGKQITIYKAEMAQLQQNTKVIQNNFEQEINSIQSELEGTNKKVSSLEIKLQKAQEILRTHRTQFDTQLADMQKELEKWEVELGKPTEEPPNLKEQIASIEALISKIMDSFK